METHKRGTNEPPTVNRDPSRKRKPLCKCDPRLAEIEVASTSTWLECPAPTAFCEWRISDSEPESESESVFFFGEGEVRLCCQQTINKIATLARSRLLCWLRLSLQFGSLFHFLLTPTRQTTIHRSTLKKNWSDLGKIKKIGDVPYKWAIILD